MLVVKEMEEISGGDVGIEFWERWLKLKVEGGGWCGNNAVEASMRIALVRTFSNGGSRVCTGHLLEPGKTSRGGSGC